MTILGCGSSGGVPRADGNWGACDPADPRNRRSRCSMMVRRRSDEGPERWTTAMVDASPEFRLQTAAAGVKRLDALLLTHDHADQSHGIDDIRAFAMSQRARIPCWVDPPTTRDDAARFGYIFHGEKGYPAIADLVAVPPHGEAWAVEGPSGAIPVVTFDQDHGADPQPSAIGSGRWPIPATCSSSTRRRSRRWQGVEVWIVDALRYTPHPTHAHVDRALGWIERVKPGEAILTNLHIDLDYRELGGRLPPRRRAGIRRHAHRT